MILEWTHASPFTLSTYGIVQLNVYIYATIDNAI